MSIPVAPEGGWRASLSALGRVIGVTDINARNVSLLQVVRRSRTEAAFVPHVDVSDLNMGTMGEIGPTQELINATHPSHGVCPEIGGFFGAPFAPSAPAFAGKPAVSGASGGTDLWP